jgi:YHS domain-containing protein
MKALYAVAVLAVVLGAAGLFAAGCKKAEPQATAPAAAGQPEIAQKICPVMGGPIDPNIHTDYKDRRIYFCCTSCLKAFEKDPEKYIAKVDEQLQGAGGTPAEALPEMPHEHR